MAKKQKYYVVWAGRQTGVFATWSECAAQVMGYNGAAYKAFGTKEAAQCAFNEGAAAHIAPRNGQKAAAKNAKSRCPLPANPPAYRHDTVLPLPQDVDANAISVDAACSGNPGKMEYRGIDLQTGQELFHFGPAFGTNNIGEFLAIVHAAALLTRQGAKKTIYSDSRNALLWVRNKKCRTKLVRNARSETTYTLIARAEDWLKSHALTMPLRKWDTERWGECPADFGRK